jgi:glycosyltransferase involved in cell wall biosynthesis
MAHNEKSPSISIAMATFNGARFVRQQIDSILNQDCPATEIAISDDNSTDATASILSEYCKNFPHIRFIQNTQQLGFVKNFEIAIQHCTGDFIALADQDDIWEPSKLQTLKSSIGSHALIHSDACVIDEGGKQIADSWSHYLGKNLNYSFLDFVAGRNNITGCTTMFKSDILSHLLPFPDNLPFHDWWLAMIASKNGGIAYSNRALLKYRLHSNNAIGNRKGLLNGTRATQAHLLYLNDIVKEANRLCMTPSEKKIAEILHSYFSRKLKALLVPINLFYAIRYYRHLFGFSKAYARNLAGSVIGSRLGHA